jgi:hypothetical protein
MKLITIRNIFFTKYILTEVPTLSEVETKLNRFKIISTEIGDENLVRYNTYRSGMVTVTLSDAKEVSYRNTQMSLLTILGGLHSLNERKYKDQNPEFINKFRQKYFSTVQKTFQPVFDENEKKRYCKWLVKRLNRIDPNYRWYHLNGKIYQVVN